MLFPLPCLADYKHTAETEQLGKRPDRGPVQPRAGHGHPDAPRRRHRLAPRVRVSLKLTFLKLLFKSSHLFSHHLVFCSCFMLVKFLKTNVFPLKLHFISPHILDINHLWSKHFKTEKNIIIITCTWIFWLFSTLKENFFLWLWQLGALEMSKLYIVLTNIRKDILSVGYTQNFPLWILVSLKIRKGTRKKRPNIFKFSLCFPLILSKHWAIN